MPSILRRMFPAVLPLIACAGCGFFAERPVMRVPAERVRQIRTVRLEEESRTPPVPLSRAATQPVERGAETRPAARPVDLSIADVRAAALSNNLDLRVELMRPDVAQQLVNEERARFEPAFVGAARHARQESVSPSGLSGAAGEFQSFDAGVRVPLRTGGTAVAGPSLNRSDVGGGGAGGGAGEGSVYDGGLRFSLSQPLLRNAGVDANTHFIRAAQYQRQVVDARTKLEAIRILASADRAYWLLFDARGELEVRQRQYELAAQQADQARKRVGAGDVPRIEITRAESGLAARLEDIIVAETLVRRRERDLKRIMNRPELPLDSEASLVPTTPPQPVGLDLNGNALADYAVSNRMEMLELELQLALDESTIDFERNRALPLFTLDYAYNLAGAGRTAREAFEVGRNNAENWSVSLAAEIPIGNRAARSRVHRAVLERVQRLATRELREQAIRQEVYDAVDELRQNWQRILAARNEAVLAGRTYEAERRQFELGRRTSTDVLDAAERLALAQSREIRAVTDYQVAQVDIAFATGTLLGHGRVVLPFPKAAR